MWYPFPVYFFPTKVLNRWFRRAQIQCIMSGDALKKSSLCLFLECTFCWRDVLNGYSFSEHCMTSLVYINLGRILPIDYTNKALTEMVLFTHLEPNRAKIGVISGITFHASQAFFFPMPLKKVVVSERVSAWENKRALHF